LLNLAWNAIDLAERTAHIPVTKTGHSRTIPLTGEALAILGDLPRTSERVFPLSPMALRLAWNRVRERAGMPDLRFHDLRHEAISRFAELGLSTMELATISGHRDMRMLARYTHIQPAGLAKKLMDKNWNDHHHYSS
jgi:integrase